MSFKHYAEKYVTSIAESFTDEAYSAIEKLSDSLLLAWRNKKSVYICGNGGSAANAMHIANDLIYGVGIDADGKSKPGLNIEALTANSGVITCLANDTGYENIFSRQLEAKAKAGDILIVLSGSGNSTNVINALSTGKNKCMDTYAVVAFSGGQCRELAQTTIHLPVKDMQIAEDTQLIVGHLCMKWMNKYKHDVIAP